MKRLLLLAIMAIMVVVTTSTYVLAEDVECPCGIDEEGQCLPCDEELDN